MAAVRFDSLAATVDWLRSRLPPAVVIAAPLGLGKPHRLLNAIYRDIVSNPGRRLTMLTALSLTPPRAGSDLERRFLEPFLARHFGTEFESLDYTVAQRANALPANVEVEEFYLQSGALLGKAQAQRRYASLNYTHVARAVARRGVAVVPHLVARSADGTRLS